MAQRRRSGFTVVELVVVIAVIAIMAAVLIPTFFSVMDNGRKAGDKTAVSSMNKMLAIENPTGLEDVSFDQAKAALAAGGFAVPRKAKADHCTYYWLPKEDRVVLYNTEKSEVEFPDEYREAERTDAWVDLSEGAEPPSEPESSDPSEPPEPEEDPTKLTHTLLKGTDFRAAVLSLCADPTEIVFGKTKNYPDQAKGESVSVSADDGVKAYRNGKKIYVLTPGKMEANANCSGMFAELTALTALDLSGLKTGSVTTMKKMFKGCSSLISLDLSGFNTASVTDMESMFEGCVNIETITVTTGEKKWNLAAVGSSSSMFEGCTKLRNYKTGIVPELIEFFTGAMRDKTFAHTGADGYLTEK